MEAIFNRKHLVLGVGDLGELSRRENKNRRRTFLTALSFFLGIFVPVFTSERRLFIPRTGGDTADGATLANITATQNWERCCPLCCLLNKSLWLPMVTRDGPPCWTEESASFGIARHLISSDVCQDTSDGKYTFFNFKQ